MTAGVWQPERCVGRGGGYCEPGRDPADVAMEEADGSWVPDVVSCEDPRPGLCWPCLTDLYFVLSDVPYELRDLDVGIAAGLVGAAPARHDLEHALDVFAQWLEITEAEVPTGRQAAVLAPWGGPPQMSRPAVLAMVVVDYLYSNVDEPEMRGLAREVTTASVRAREIIFIPADDR